jgi:hypothetical protein
MRTVTTRYLLLLAAAAALLTVKADRADPRLNTYVSPVRILWMTENGEKRSIKNSEALMRKRFGQVPEGKFWKGDGCLFTNNGENPAILLDFGREIHGGIEIGCGLYTEDKALTRSTVKCRIRLGESATEAMSELREKGACNGHGMRDMTEDLISNGMRFFGDMGFRFVRIDLLEPGTLQLEYVKAVSRMRPFRKVGDFRSSDERLNRIFDTALQTANLCAQTFIWDGIKRDRLVWAGDMYPQICTHLAVYGNEPVIAESLAYLADITPADSWMCIPSYSMWWLCGVYEHYFATGDKSFISARKGYIAETYGNLARHIAADGACTISNAVLDWPTRKNQPAARAGHQALFSHTFAVGSKIAKALGDEAWADDLSAKAAKTALKGLSHHGSKPAAAMLSLYGLRPAGEMYSLSLSRDGLSGMSTFFGYFILDAMAKAGAKAHSVDTLRDYWGAMLDMGATSFWEGFDVSWTNNAVRIDELPVAGRPNIHADNGDFCYKGLRNSLCHGWSSSPAAWLIHNVLGVRPVAPGCREVAVEPFLGDLEWAEGALATPFGPVKVSVRKMPDGSLKTDVCAPKEVKIVRR